MKYTIGTRFIRNGDKHKRIYTIIDYYITTNHAGEVVKSRYVAGYEMLGQILIDPDITQTTIDKATIVQQ